MNRQIRVMLAALLAVMGILVLLPSGYVGAGGMVANPGFEEGAAEVPDAWNLTGNATRVDTDPIYEGNWTAQITGSDDTLTQWICLGNTSLPLPVTYDVWGWIYASGNVTGVITFDCWTAANGTQVSAATELSANDTNGIYVQETGSIVAPLGTTCVRIRLLGSGWSEGAEVRFDEIGFWPVTGYCFIATAAYGTETAPQLRILRDFRDQVLLKNALGARFVGAYYKLSPPVANVIAKNDFLRAVVRGALVDPLVHLLRWSQSFWRA
jgi:hypothetical protein